MLSLALTDSLCRTPPETFAPDLYDEMLYACIPDPRLQGAGLPVPTALSAVEIAAFRRAERPLWRDATWFAAKFLAGMLALYAVVVVMLLLSGGAA